MIRERDLWRIGSQVCTPRQWQAIILVYGQQLTHRQAGMQMAITEEAVGRLINRGIRAIRNHNGGQP